MGKADEPRETVVETRDLSKVYPPRGFGKPFKALDGLSIRIQAGEIFGLVGLNGAGKSTTNKILLGFVHPTTGEARLLGLPPTDPRARARLGYLPEVLVLEETLTGREIVEFAARLSGVPAEGRTARIDEVIALVGMAHAARKLVRDYSKGMRQRIGIAQALVHRPALIILDEPFGGLDPKGRQMLKDIVRQVRDEGTAVLMSTHQLLEAEDLCDRVGVIHRGKLLGQWTIPAILANHPGKNLEKAFLSLVGDAVVEEAGVAEARS